ncbi:unnamed protein product [Rodentolepis nana]|uniref:2Fe-2S ferredoxin-type domain-containing protein n=1 Tax=Rodentolepis nana TaxID=102285 RepID=A0A0R3T6V5_RODNA|nr:unnamed protein product [Rodentolepis nana]
MLPLLFRRASRALIAKTFRPRLPFEKIQFNYFSTVPTTVQLTFEWPDGCSHKTVRANVGDTLFDVVLNNNLDIDGFGACDGELACSTCHLILSDDVYNKLSNPPSEEELDLLDTAPHITDT